MCGVAGWFEYRVGRLTSCALVVLTIVAAVAFPLLACAAAPGSIPRPVGRDAEDWRSGDGWHLRLGTALRDTLDATAAEAFVAARRALEDDEWELESSREEFGELTTRWKTIHNFFFRLFAGAAYGRCMATVRALSLHSVEVTFQGGLATRRNIEHKPVNGLAARSYLSAARVWLREVRELAASLHNASPACEARIR